MTDQFPEFEGGDVRVVLTTGRQYQLHASILRQHSRTMRDLLNPRTAIDLSSRAVRKGASTRWKMVLVPTDDEDAALRFQLSIVPLTDSGVEPRGSTTTIVVENENGRVSDPLFKAYHSILAALHGLPIDLGDAQEDNMADLLKAALEALSVAEYLQCVPIVTGPIEATLLATGQNLYRAIAENPTGWLVFSDRIRSRAIFKEAMIHAVGRYNTDKIQTVIHDGAMHDGIVSILERKAQEVINGVSITMRRLSAYYPISLTRVATVGRIDKDNTGRADYGNDILGWMALCVFRHWLGDMMATDHTTHDKDMGFFFIQLIAQGGNAYLNRTLMQQSFHAKFPMSPKGMNAVEFRLTEIKNNVKDYVKGYFKPTCQLDLHRYPVKHYTHTNIAPEDFPWHAEQAAARNADIERVMYGLGNADEDEDLDEDGDLTSVYGASEAEAHEEGSGYEGGNDAEGSDTGTQQNDQDDDNGEDDDGDTS
ncbi:uncharacterized protein RCC_00838 [Ramularia collo-cygni]|uniref:BTB domain-containing protein n=1 Tax=Ramularia collo-cygni TaxID=112498 RepID=A0A2D3UPN0_9PEZI|nr:uncharacterized protein RCC_00838 [Ramularia collo-cygni]CZT14905.1 uncharacterized protein RCC_00838 [Ramularia collo-cygni]